jgi:hypothetical protein
MSLTDCLHKKEIHTKKCIECERTLPIHEFYLYPNGLHKSRCKKCLNDASNKRKKESGYKPRPSEYKRVKDIFKLGKFICY